MNLRNDNLSPEAKELLDKMYAERGYELQYHRILAQFDPDLLKSLNTSYERLNFESKYLDPKTRELAFIGILATEHEWVGLPIHFKRALDAGATEEEIMEVICQMLVCIGLPTVLYTLEKWVEFLKKEGRYIGKEED